MAALPLQLVTAESNYYETRNNIIFYDRTSPGCEALAGTGGGISADISRNIPPAWAEVFSAAAEKYNVNPNFLAALYLTEQGNTWKSVGSTDWASSPVGASGPMQFMPGTWDSYSKDGDGDGTKDIMNVWDAVFAAADMVSKNGTDKNTPLGDIEKPYKSGTLLYMAAAYNWGSGNVQTHTSSSSALSAGPVETQNYLKNIHSLLTSDFTKSGHENYHDPVIGQADKNGDSAIAQGDLSSTDCASEDEIGGVGIANGFTFPLRTTKAALKKGADGSVWCAGNLSNCHHDYNAADIFAETNTPILAAKAGVVKSKSISSCDYYGCNVTIKGEDGILYYYTHMHTPSPVSVGASVKAGQQIGKVGTNASAMNTPRHLHFDMLPKSYDFRPGCSSESCTAYPFINVQTYLIPAYKRLP